MSDTEKQYCPFYCGEAVLYMGEGHGSVAFAGNIGVRHARLDQWAREHPEFAQALGIGRARNVMFWEHKLAEIARTGMGNASAAIYGLKHAAAEWAAAQEKEAPRQTMSDLELARRIARILELGRQAEAKEAKVKAAADENPGAEEAATPAPASEPPSHDG